MEEQGNGKYKVSSISYNDIVPGDRVVYIASIDGARTVIKIED